MTALEIGTKLVDLVTAGKHHEAMETLYHPNIVSIEAGAPPGQSTEAKGLGACIEKGKQFAQRMEVHSGSVDGPFPHGNRFAVFYDYDVTPRAGGERFHLKEVGLYTVEGDKIVREEFFYKM
ncbi:MAG: nuclear transport factor 2 family protein [Kofleriaceae bacterium]